MFYWFFFEFWTSIKKILNLLLKQNKNSSLCNKTREIAIWDVWNIRVSWKRVKLRFLHNFLDLKISKNFNTPALEGFWKNLNTTFCNYRILIVPEDVWLNADLNYLHSYLGIFLFTIKNVCHLSIDALHYLCPLICYIYVYNKPRLGNWTLRTFKCPKSVSKTLY